MQSDSRTESLWRTIISELTVAPQDMQTILQDGSGGIWIHASADGDTVIINRAKSSTPSSQLMYPRIITRSEFAKLHPLFSQWRNGEISRVKITQVSQNSSYIFALINRFSNSDTEIK